MTLTKAIEILDDMLKEDPYLHLDDRADAIQLGIEALTEVLKARDGNPLLDGFLLPNETEEYV